MEPAGQARLAAATEQLDEATAPHVAERTQGRAAEGRDLLDSSLLVFRQAGDLRCVTRTLLELAGQDRPGDPAAAADLLLQALQTAALADGGPLCAQVLLQEPSYGTYAAEGRAGGISLIATLYPR